MRTSLRFAVRFFVIVAVVAGASIFMTEPAGRSPYLSALGDLAVSSASAAPGCNNKTCTAGPRISFKCISNPGTNCTSTHHDCSNSVC